MTLSDPVKAYKILKATRLTVEDRHLVLSNCSKLEYEAVKNSLEHIFSVNGLVVAQECRLLVVKERLLLQDIIIEDVGEVDFNVAIITLQTLEKSPSIIAMLGDVMDADQKIIL